MTYTKIANAGTRHLILVDAENMAATPSPSGWDAELLRAGLERLVPDFGSAQRIVACSHHAAPVISFTFPGARHLWRSGRDGADLTLLDVMENEHVNQRFGRVTLCSGDGIFAASVARLGGEGVDVTVVAREWGLARRLELAARHVVKVPNAYWLFGKERAS